MKKILALLSALIIFAMCFCGCAEKKTDGKLNIVTTVFPLYDWARVLTAGAENTEVSLLLKNGADMHSFQPSANDIVGISQSDIFLYIGGESDSRLDGILNDSLTSVSMLEALGDRAKTEERVEGMETDEDDGALDEHVWLSLKNAQILCEKICGVLCEKDPVNTELYKNNLKDYIVKLKKLDSEYAAAVKAGKTDTLLFADRFPFRYLTDDYGLHYYAAFAGCSADSEASFKTIAFLSKKVDELSLKYVLKIENSDDSIAKTVINNTKNKNQTILTVNSLQSVSEQQKAEGITYISVMEKNLDVIKQAVK